MKPLILPLLLSLSTLCCFADNKDFYRTFHDAQGRAIRAVIVRTGPDNVWIRRDDGQTFHVAVSLFSKADQEFISQWERAKALSDPTALQFSARRFSDGRETNKDDSRKTTVERFGYIVTLTNQTTFDLEDLDIEYRTFAWRGEVGVTGRKRALESHPGSTKIQNLAARQKQEFKTTAIALTSVALRPGWLFGTTNNSVSNQRRITDDLGGIWIRIRQGNEIIAEFSTPSKLMETEFW